MEEIERVCILFVKCGDLGSGGPVWPLALLRERERQSSEKGKAESGFKKVLLLFFFLILCCRGNLWEFQKFRFYMYI